MRFYFSLLIIFLCIVRYINAQDNQYKSIHQEQAEYYENLGLTTQSQFDLLNGFKILPKSNKKNNCTLKKIVFGWHPYWAGSAYLNYQWNLISDLSYFGYGVNANTGEANSIHDWLTTAAIDSAQSNGTRVNLCATLFSDHATFFASSASQQTLIDNLISLVQQRNANGVNIDFEGVPSSQSANFTDFMIDLCNQFHTQIPGSIVSIALPSVNWNSTFDVNAMNPYIDLFIIMGYNYYYSGSSNAGPVSPKNHGNFWSQYDVSRSIVYYLYQGVSRSKLCLGIPYYGFDWPTTDNTVISSTTGSGTAKFYKNAVQNAQIYGRLWDNPSSTPYYMYQNSGWHQTWYDDEESLGLKYDVVNIQDIAGIGIWALGYDDGYTELWDIIEQKFTNCAPPVTCDGTITDMGGPGDYYNNEDWTYTIAPPNASSVSLTFNSFDVELNYDTLFVYDGIGVTYPLIGTYTGTTNPGTLIANSGAITLRFQSDGATTALGWVANWTCLLDSIPPSTSINVNGLWQTSDFTATFTDTDNEAIDLQFYQVLDFNGTEWRANGNNGFFNDNFEISINADWTIEAGTWSINSSHLNQADEIESNTNIHIPVAQVSGTTYLYHWSMKISGSGTNRRAGMHFFCDDATQPNRHNSYMVYFRVDQNKAQIYKYVNDTMNLQTDDDCNVDIDTWYDYKVIFNTSTGEINAFQNDILVSSWTDPVPYISGNSISLRTGDCNVMYDDIKVYKSRGNTEIVTIGTNPDDDVRYQNQNPATASCRIKSVVTDVSNNFSAIDGLDVNIDWTAPSDISVYDGLISDIDTTYDNTILSANWTLSIDTNSNISHYWYCIGNLPYDSNIVAWTNNGLSNSVTHQGLSLPYDETYYFSVRAENGAGLMSNTSVSDGQLLVMPVFPPVVNFSYSDTNICDGDSVMFLNFTINATSYLWTFSGGSPAMSNALHPAVYFSSSGTYIVKLVATGPAGIDSLIQNITITVNPLPGADFYAFDTLLYLPSATAYFMNNSVNADSYFWDFGDGSTSSDQNPWHDYTQTGYYTITLIAISNNCSDDTLILYDYIYVEPESGVNEFDTEFFINVYPNPNKGTFQLSFGVDMLKNVSIQVVNNLGQVVYEEVHKNFNGNYSEEIDISSLANGVYILNIKVGENTYTENISVLR